MRVEHGIGYSWVYLPSGVRLSIDWFSHIARLRWPPLAVAKVVAFDFGRFYSWWRMHPRYSWNRDRFLALIAHGCRQ